MGSKGISKNQEKEKFKRTLELSDYVHPTLVQEGNTLEYYVHKLSLCVFKFLIEQGANSQLREIELSRLSECAVTIFAMASSLARASRSHSDGFQHSGFEICLARTIVASCEKPMEIDFANLIEDKVSTRHDLLLHCVELYYKH